MASELFSLQGKSAVVTGAGNPLAYAIGLALADAGANVAAVSTRQDAAQRLADAVQGMGRTGIAITADTTRSSEVQRMTDAAVQGLGQVDILIAGEEVVYAGPVAEADEDAWDTVMSVNAKSVHLCAQRLGGAMKERGNGRVIVLAHALGIAGVPNTALYSASKGAALQYVRSLGLEWATSGVTVNAIATGWFEDVWPDPSLAPDQLQRFNPMRRLGDPQELGPLAVYLASDEAAYVTASVTVIDGGQICHA